MKIVVFLLLLPNLNSFAIITKRTLQEVEQENTKLESTIERLDNENDIYSKNKDLQQQLKEKLAKQDELINQLINHKNQLVDEAESAHAQYQIEYQILKKKHDSTKTVEEADEVNDDIQKLNSNYSNTKDEIAKKINEINVQLKKQPGYVPPPVPHQHEFLGGSKW